MIRCFFPLLLGGIGVFSTSLSAQLIAYESFSGLSVGANATASGSDASGWSQVAWVGSPAPRFKIGDPLPDLSHQVSGGQEITGGDRALEVTTAPPATTTAGQFLERQFPPVNTTIYFSCLIRITEIGTGSEAIFINFGNSTQTLQGLVIRPGQGQTFATLDVPLVFNTISNRGDLETINPNETYLLVARLTWEEGTTLNLTAEYWLNPPANFPGSPGSFTKNSFSLPVEPLDRMSFLVRTSDESGPSTTAQIDEIRIGYSWQDVVLESATAEVVSTTELREARHLRWQSATGKTYQPEFSYDLITWQPIGTSIIGDGTLKGVFDDTEGTEKKFYRVEVTNTP